ncbi:hypothetical protein SteCoe_26819 [Stentor coeruleus]|uniref:Hexose transporter 1 n=1 Tax=Stentor coeruleus TaxID=5963 RepID=A0A1R2BC10_9CILI|nr:hypothetical protein SteCoe_26819 [Stentor coeruleus]
MKTIYYFYTLTFITSIGSFEFGYNIAILNNIIKSFNQLYLNILTPSGAILGCFLGCFIANAYGRRNCIFFMNALNILGSGICICIVSIKENQSLIYVFIIGRIFSGISTGIASYIVPLYIREMAYQEYYVRLGSINQFMITFGILLAYVLGYACQASDTLYMIFIVPIIANLIQILFFWKVYTQDTPTYLINSGKRKQAIDLISKLYFNNEIEEKGSQELIDLDISTDSISPSHGSFFKNLMQNESLKMGCIIALLQQLTGINIYMMNSSHILQNLNHLDSQISTIIIGAVNCISGSLSMFILKSHYKINLQIGAVWMGICYIIVLSTLTSEDFFYIYFVCIIMFIIAFEISIGPIMWIYCADVLSDKGVAITSAMNWVGVLFITGMFAIFDGMLDLKNIDNQPGVAFIVMNVFYFVFCCVMLYYSRWRIKERMELYEMSQKRFSVSM